MNPNKIFKLKWWQVAFFMVATTSFGVLVGLYFGDFFINFISLLWILFLVPGLYITYLWIKQK